MSHRLFILPSCVLVLALVSITLPALAQNTAYIQAERFGARARLAQLAAKPKVAAAAFERAYDILPNPAYLLKAGTAYTNAADWASAARVYSNLLERPMGKSQKTIASQGLERAKAKLGGDRARLAVYFDPPTAKVMVDGVEVAYGNPATVWVRAGEHTISVKDTGYTALQKTVTMNRNEPYSLEVTLQSVAGGVGILRIQSNVESASVYINEEIEGETPFGDFELAAGVYDLKLIKNGFEVWNRSISIEAQRPTEVDAQMTHLRAVAVSGGAPEVAAATKVTPASEAAMTAAVEAPEEEDPAEEFGEEITEISMADMADDEDDFGAFDSEPMATAVEDDGESSGLFSILGWSLVGLGAATAGGGVYFTIAAMGQQTELDAFSDEAAYLAQGWQQQDWYDQIYLPNYNDLTPKIEDNNLYSYILYGSGGALIIGGVVLLFLDDGDDASDTVEYSDKPTWTGFGVNPVSGGSVFSTGFRF